LKLYHKNNINITKSDPILFL